MSPNANGHKAIVRWRIMLALYKARPRKLDGEMVAFIVNDKAITVTRDQVRSAMQYLCDKGFVEIDVDDGDDQWFARLKSSGVDFVEYTDKEEQNGIARPFQGYQF